MLEDERDERMEELTAAIEASTKVRTAEKKEPSSHAKIAFWVSIVNSGGLMLLGAYCIKGAVDQAFLTTFGAFVAAAAAWGRL